MKQAIPRFEDLSSDIEEFEEETILVNCQNVVQNYESFKKRRRNGKLGTKLQSSELCTWIWWSINWWHTLLSRKTIWKWGCLHGKVCCHTTFTSTRQIMQGRGRTTFSSCTIWKRYILEWNHYLKERSSVCKLRIFTLYKHQPINVVNRPLIGMQNYR